MTEATLSVAQTCHAIAMSADASVQRKCMWTSLYSRGNGCEAYTLYETALSECCIQTCVYVCAH